MGLEGMRRRQRRNMVERCPASWRRKEGENEVHR